MNYNDIFKNKRERVGMTLKEVANLLEIDDSLYSKYEKNVRTIPTIHLSNLCNIYNISVDYAFGITDKEQYKKLKKVIDKDISGKRIKEFRKENNITQDKLAKTLNTTQSVISAYEKGKTLILSSFLYTICKKYKISADYLLGKIDEPKYIK